MELSKIVERILEITNESPYGRLGMDSSEAGEIWKLLNKELNKGQSLPIDSVTNRFLSIAHYPSMEHNIHDVIELPSEEWKHADGTYCDAKYFLDYPDHFKKM